MKDKTAVDHRDDLNRERQEEVFSLWDAFDLAFGEIYPPDLLKPLIDLLSHMDTGKQVDALRTLGEIGRRLPDGPKKGVIAYLLSKHLEDSQTEVRITAVQAIGMLTRQTLSKALTSKLINDESTRVRIASTDALGELTMSVTLHALKESLHDQSWEVRAAAIQTLGKLGEQLIIEPVKEALDDEDFSVRSAALHMLGTFKGCLSTDYLVSLAQEEMLDWITRDAAVTVLERIGENILAQPLRERLNIELEAENAFAEEEISTAEEALSTSGDTEDWISTVEYEESGTKHRQQEPEEAPPIPLENGENGEEKGTSRAKSFHELRHGHKRKEWIGSLSDLNKRIKKKKYALQWSKWGEKIAYGLHYLKRRDLFVNMRGGILIAFCLCFLIENSMVRSYASNTQTISTWDASQQKNDARLVVIFQPKLVIPGQRFSVKLTAINTGLATWTHRENYQLIRDTNNTQGLNCIDKDALIISHPVSSTGGIYTFALPFIAPPTTGTYTSCWTMAHNNVPFGNKICIKVHIA